MNKPLVIVESPAKAKTIKKYFGNKYIVKSSIGHIRDLPKKSTFSKNKKTIKKEDFLSKLINRIGLEPFKNWRANYQILPEKEKIVSELKLLAKNVNCIYLATDFDREGEAIAWHLKEVIGGDQLRYKRIVFNEITKNSISHAFSKPNEINMHWVHAQQARRFMDRIVGYMLSPLLWKKVARGLSAGRVQSVAVRLVVEKEREIKKFIPQEYWTLIVKLKTSENFILSMQVTKKNNKKFQPKNKKIVEKAINELKFSRYIVDNLKEKIVHEHPNAPFITATLQQTSNIKLGFSVKKTMQLAQKLYESGYITYMRTDSFNLNKEALFTLKNYIKKRFGSKYILKHPIQYKNKKNAQEAHEAIRPSDVNISDEHLINIEDDGKKLYKLIWMQFVSCQMPSVQYKKYVITVHAGNFKLLYQERILVFDGWRKIEPSFYKKEQKEKNFLKFKIGEHLILENLEPTQHYTKPVKRFTEASLVRELEKRGIGRPSTYASIISTIQNRGYIRIDNRSLYAEKIGEVVTERLLDNFHNLMSYNFTAYMENQLDDISKNKLLWTDVLNQFFYEFYNQFMQASKDYNEGGMKTNKITLTSILCSICGKNMGIKIAKTGIFLTCIGYLNSVKKRCTHTKNLLPENKLIKFIQQEEKKLVFSFENCAKCNILMDNYFILDNQLKFQICGNHPICDQYKITKVNFKINNQCLKCGAQMNLKMGRFGEFMSCINTSCKNTQKILSNGSIAVPKDNPIPLPELSCKKSDAYFVLYNGASGIFLAANTFPKHKETRTPFVAELKLFKKKLPKKLHYLTEAPAQDDFGNQTIVAFNKKNQEQYILSKKNGKNTGWKAFFKNGSWEITRSKKI